MRVRESVTKIMQHPIYMELQKIKNASETEFYRRYNFKLYEHRQRYGPGDDYSTRADYYLINTFIKQLPQIDCKITFEYGIWGKISAFIKVEVNQYDHNKIDKRIHFHSVTGSANKILWNHKFELLDNFNLGNPLPQLKAMLKTVLFECGFIASIQRYESCTKIQSVQYYKNHYAKGKLNYGAIDEDTIYKWIKKHFNIDSYLPIDKTINYVNANGKHATPTKLDKYDHSWIFDFDGDMDDIENEFYNTLDSNTIYI